MALAVLAAVASLPLCASLPREGKVAHVGAEAACRALLACGDKHSAAPLFGPCEESGACLCVDARRPVARDAAYRAHSSVDAASRRVVYRYDAADRLVSATVSAGTNAYAETYLHDACGALTNVTRGAEVQTYKYDLAGRLTFASASGAALSVTYDALGNRLTTYAADATRLWATDHADPLKRPLMEADASGAPIRWYVWGGGLLLAVVEADGTVRYAHSDEQGSVIALTDASGTVTDHFCYGPFGADWGHSGTNAIPFRWLGSHGVLAVSSFIPHPSSFSSLFLTRHRAYDAALGRFLSADPLGLGGGPNLYAYCLGNPLAYIDPLGLSVAAGVSFLGNTFLNAGDIAGAWELAAGADYGTARGWGEGALGAVGGLALALDAAGNLVPGKALIQAAVKSGAKEVAAALGKAFGRDAAGSLMEGVSKAAKSPAGLLTTGTRTPNAGGVIRSFAQEGDQVYYRVFSEKAQCSFLTATPPRSSAWAREALSLPEGNQATYIQEVLVPAGTRLQRSRALPAFGRQDGAEQFELLEQIPNGNFGPGRTFP